MFWIGMVWPILLLLCELDLWSTTGCYTEAIDVSHWWTPIEPSLCLKTPHPIHNYLMWYDCLRNKARQLRPTSLLWQQDLTLGQLSPITFCTGSSKCTPKIKCCCPESWGILATSLYLHSEAQHRPHILNQTSCCLSVNDTILTYG